MVRIASLGFILCMVGSPQLSAASDRMNVLFIAVDDLRPDVGCYGNAHVKSPNIDKLAASGMTFMRAYCQQAVCSPTRTSLMCGRRPDTTQVWDLNTHFRRNIPDVVTLAEHFKNNGYHTQGLSKIYHGGFDDPQSWSVPHWAPDGQPYTNSETLKRLEKRRAQRRANSQPEGEQILEKDPKTGLVLKTGGPKGNLKGPPWEIAEVPDDGLPDGKTADKAIDVMRHVKDKPFFLAVGFLKPHLPFVAPKKYYELYPLNGIAPAANDYPPKDVPDIALTNWGELRAYEGMPKTGPVSEQQARELIRGYRAATSYTDAQIGRVLDELDRLHLADKTIVVLWGDHGWQLGEHGLWCKHTNFEVAAHTLLLLRAPGHKPGQKTEALVEFVDVYPTLCELAGLPLPAGLEGTSMAPLLDNPDIAWKKAAFSQFPRENNVMGYSIRTDRYRYTEWVQRPRPDNTTTAPAANPMNGKIVGFELYDHQADPDENVNLAGQPEFKETVAELSRQLHAGWKAAVP